DNIRRLRHHPSIALWCGNNEIEFSCFMGEAWDDYKMSWEAYGELFVPILKDIPGLMADLEAAGSDFDEEVAQSQDDPASFSPASLKSLLAKARTSAEVRRTLEKYNWDGRFWDVYYTIYVGVYVSMMDQALVQYPSPELKALVDPFRTSIHKDDHALVLRNLPRLLEVFEALDAED
ncbi:MAG TPA: hypothetical protein P5117_17330, partial [Spirochaetia bacterium]|nr:hypothetical protein [Spirochaetia bacterium]